MRTEARRVTLAVAAALSLGVVSLHPSTARACDGTRPWVLINVDEGWDPDVGPVIDDLRAELDVLNIDACAQAERSDVAPLAEVLLGREGDEVAVDIEISDAVTNKYVGRTIPLADVPAPARRLTIALAVVELLRASWIELRLRSAPEPTQEVPEAVEQAVENDIEPPTPPPAPPPQNALTLGLVGELAIGGLGQVGGVLRYERWIFAALSVAVSGGARYGFPFNSSEGEVDARVFSVSAMFRLALTPRRTPFTVGLEAGATLLVLRFAATPSEGFIAQERSDLGISVRAGVYGRAQLIGPLAIEATFGMGFPVLGVVVTNSEGAEIGGVASVEVVGSLGPSIVF